MLGWVYVGIWAGAVGSILTLGLCIWLITLDREWLKWNLFFLVFLAVLMMLGIGVIGRSEEARTGFGVLYGLGNIGFGLFMINKKERNAS